MKTTRSWLVAASLMAALPALHAQLLIGQTAGFTGTVASGVKETTDGARLWIDSINAKGGVNGQKIELVQMDDKFDPKLAAENAKTLIEEKNVLALFLVRGTPHSEAMFPILEANNVALVAPSTGAMSLHQPVKRHVYNVRATYQREAEKAVDHLAAVGIVRIAVLVADDSFGTDAVQGAIRGLERHKLKPVVQIKHDRLKPDYTKLIPELVKSEAQAVIWIGSGSAVADGVKALRAAGSAAQVVTLSNNASSGFVKSLGEHSRGVILTQVFPYERSIGSPMVKEAMDVAKARGVDSLSPAMLEGYAGAKVLVEALRRAGKSPTRASLLAALDGMKKFDVGGLEVSYSENDHTGLDFVDLSIIGPDGKFKR